MGELFLRTARLEDVPVLLDIYRPYVENTAITFEYHVPSVEEFSARMQCILQKHPYLVAEKDGVIWGYAYTGDFVGRAAYGWSVETTIYLDQSKCGVGLGRKLYGAIEKISQAQGIQNLNACIAYPEKDDHYLTKNSVQFHAHLGFQLVGKFHNCGYKFGRWYSMVWMEKLIGTHPEIPEPVIPFLELDEKMFLKAGLSFEKRFSAP